MRKLYYSVLIAIGVSACVESDIESPSSQKPQALTTSENSITGVGSGNVDEAKQIAAITKTPITQAEFDSIIANTPEGQPVVIKRRSGPGLSIGNPNVAGYHPDLLTFEFVECEFDNSLVITNTGQAVVNLRRCVMPTLSLETVGVVQQMEIKRSTITSLRTIDGSRCNDLTIIGGKISQILNDSGGDSQTFRTINFQ